MSNDNIPVIVGVGRLTQRTGSDIDSALDPIQLMAVAARRTVADAIYGTAITEDAVLAHLDFVSTVMMFLELRVPKGVPPFYRNPSMALAQAIGVSPHVQCFQSDLGGHSPQMLVNELAERLTHGHFRMGLVAGGECLNTLIQAVKAGRFQMPGGATISDAAGRKYSGSRSQNQLVWGDELGTPKAKFMGKAVEITSPHETKHGLATPTTAYAIFDQALRVKLGRTIEEHLNHNAKLFEGFSQVAAGAAEHSWFPVARSATELATVTSKNRAVTYPGYPKYMNSVMDVDQAAAVLLTTVGEARRLGVPESRWVYLHGSADCTEEPASILARPDLHRSHALAAIGKELVASAGVSLDKVELFDIYSCFPVAVEVACRELGLGESRNGMELTVTGGLPYHGGAGNAYSMFGIAAMCEKLREKPGAFGLVTANGGYLTKHSAGIYSTTPYSITHPHATHWQRTDPAELQQRLKAQAVVLPVAVVAEGRGVVDSYTVEHDTSGPTRAVVVGRLVEGMNAGHRFVATSSEANAIHVILSRDIIGTEGRVTTSGGRCTFWPDGVGNPARL